MIQFNNIRKDTPFQIFKNKYEEALEAGQKNIEAVSISSYNNLKNEVDSRFVNLKKIDNDKFIFYSNYNSPKAIAFSLHNQISALFFWSSTNTQIRLKAKIMKTSTKENNAYFRKRSLEKNALAISSRQSNVINNFDEVIFKFNSAKSKDNLKICPDYWGGFSFVPFEIEFWKGDEYRLNRRDLFIKERNTWKSFILEP